MGSSLYPLPYISLKNPSIQRAKKGSLGSIFNVKAMAKELYFNHDGSAMKKLQVKILMFLTVWNIYIYIYPSGGVNEFICHCFRQGWIWWQTWLESLWVQKEGMWCCRINMDLQRLLMMVKLFLKRWDFLFISLSFCF